MLSTLPTKICPVSEDKGDGDGYGHRHWKIAIYRILQEALSNAYHHAGVDHHWVHLWSEDSMICMTAIDKGKGFDPPPLNGPMATEREEHIGLRGMRDRVALLGGKFSLTSSPGEETRILVKVPANV